LLDLFCGAGGAAMGYHRAGFDVVGVDHVAQPHYPFEFHQGDALAERWDTILGPFDAIHASPPCQAFTALKVMPNARQHADLLTPTRDLLIETGLPYVIENVPGAPMDDVRPPDLFGGGGGVVLCGSTFGLNNGEYELRRHRWFESNLVLEQPQCAHRLPVIGFYGGHARTRQRTVSVHRDRGGDIVGNARKMPLVRDLMGIDWMTLAEAGHAIPPAYTEFIGTQLMAHLGVTT